MSSLVRSILSSDLFLMVCCLYHSAYHRFSKSYQWSLAAYILWSFC